MALEDYEVDQAHIEYLITAGSPEGYWPQTGIGGQLPQPIVQGRVLYLDNGKIKALPIAS